MCVCLRELDRRVRVYVCLRLSERECMCAHTCTSVHACLRKDIGAPGKDPWFSKNILILLASPSFLPGAAL